MNRKTRHVVVPKPKDFYRKGVLPPSVADEQVGTDLPPHLQLTTKPSIGQSYRIKGVAKKLKALKNKKKRVLSKKGTS